MAISQAVLTTPHKSTSVGNAAVASATVIDKTKVATPSPVSAQVSNSLPTSRGLLITKPEAILKSSLVSPTAPSKTIVEKKDTSCLSSLLAAPTTEIKAQVNQINEKLKVRFSSFSLLYCRILIAFSLVCFLVCLLFFFSYIVFWEAELTG